MASSLYNESDPSNATAANVIGTDIQDVRQDFRERLQQGGKRFTGFDSDVPTTEEQHDGKTCVGWENQTDRDDSGYVTLAWSHDGTTELLRQYGPDHSTKPNVLEIAGAIQVIGGGSPTFPGKSLGADEWARIYKDSIGGAAQYIKQILYKASSASGAPNRSLTKLKVVLGTTGSGCTFDVRKRTVAQQSGSNNPFDDATTTSITGGSITISAGVYSTEVTLGTPATLSPGEELVVKKSANTVTDLTFLALVE